MLKFLRAKTKELRGFVWLQSSKCFPFAPWAIHWNHLPKVTNQPLIVEKEHINF